MRQYQPAQNASPVRLYLSSTYIVEADWTRPATVMACSRLHCSANLRSSSCVSLGMTSRGPLCVRSPLLRCPLLHRQFGSSPALPRRTPGSTRQRTPRHKTEAGYPSWFRFKNNITPNTAAAAAASAQAAAILSTPLWLHAVKGACSVIAAWVIAVTVSRWLVTSADKLEAGEVRPRLPTTFLIILPTVGTKLLCTNA